jgi:hypothetical protein
MQPCVTGVATWFRSVGSQPSETKKHNVSRHSHEAGPLSTSTLALPRADVKRLPDCAPHAHPIHLAQQPVANTAHRSAQLAVEQLQPPAEHYVWLERLPPGFALLLVELLRERCKVLCALREVTRALLQALKTLLPLL